MFERLRELAPPDSFSGPQSEEAVLKAEGRLGVQFPKSYTLFLLEFGSAVWPDLIYGLLGGKGCGQGVIECTFRERTLLHPHIRQHLVPVSPDGFGNHFCLDTSKMSEAGECPVVFWDHDLGEDQDCPIEFDAFPALVED